MSVLNDFEYFKLNAQQASGLDSLSFDKTDFLKQPRNPSPLWRGMKKVLGKIWTFLKDIFREDPSNHNEKVSRRSYDYPPIRGLW